MNNASTSCRPLLGLVALGLVGCAIQQEVAYVEPPSHRTAFVTVPSTHPPTYVTIYPEAAKCFEPRKPQRDEFLPNGGGFRYKVLADKRLGLLLIASRPTAGASALTFLRCEIFLAFEPRAGREYEVGFRMQGSDGSAVCLGEVSEVRGSRRVPATDIAVEQMETPKWGFDASCSPKAPTK